MAKTLPTAYLNGEFLPLDETRISPLDRGFLFADGVYEVIPVYGGRLFRVGEHLARLEQSLNAVRIPNPYTPGRWQEMLTELVKRNGGGNQAVYLQVTRGAAPVRDHAFPQNVPPTVFAMTSELVPPAAHALENGVAVITLEDIRWARCDIKSIALLPNVLVKQQALDAGAVEAVFTRGGFVIEGAATTVFTVTDGVIHTPPKSYELLPGITRDVVLELAARNGIPCREERISLDNLFTADEVWIASSTREISAVTTLDGKPLGAGKPGPMWRKMHEYFQAFKAALMQT